MERLVVCGRASVPRIPGGYPLKPHNYRFNGIGQSRISSNYLLRIKKNISFFAYVFFVCVLFALLSVLHLFYSRLYLSPFRMFLQMFFFRSEKFDGYSKDAKKI